MTDGMKHDPLGTQDWPIAKPALPSPGSRVRLMVDVDRYPHFTAPKGATGTVTAHPGIFAVRLDEPLAGAEDWDNEVHWIIENGDDPTGDIEIIEEES
jgi:hypothetical protein